MGGRTRTRPPTAGGRWGSRLPAGLIAVAVAVVSACTGGRGSADGEPAPASAALSGPTDSGQGSGDAGTGSVHPVTAVVISDDAALSAGGVPDEAAWPALLAAALDGTGTPLDVQVAATEGAGFAPDASGETFTDLVLGKVVHSTQLVFFFETRYGNASAQGVQEGARLAFKNVEEQAPDALIVVVGPWAAGPDNPGPRGGIGSAVAEAALGAELPVTYVDPVAEGWPDDAGEQQIADLLRPHVADLAAALAGSGAFD